MPIVNSKKMFEMAYKGGYAIGAFNVNNMETIQGIVNAGVKQNAPLILQVSSGARKYANPLYLKHLVQAAEEDTGLPIVLHLDHGDSFELCKSCIDGGFTSVMIDGSKLPYEENVALTKKVVDYAHEHGVVVEAELGKVGGKEDDLDGGAGGYTDPAEATEFVEKTGVDFLAVAIGTAHGVYKGIPKLDLDRLSEIRKVVSIPLVLHGTSGVPDETVKECIKRGICKVNYATDLRIAFTEGVKSVLTEKPDTIDPKKYNAAGRALEMSPAEYMKERFDELMIGQEEQDPGMSMGM